MKVAKQKRLFVGEGSGTWFTLWSEPGIAVLFEGKE